MRPRVKIANRNPWYDKMRIDITKILMTNGSLMKVESIAECSPWSIRGASRNNEMTQFPAAQFYFCFHLFTSADFKVFLGY